MTQGACEALAQDNLSKSEECVDTEPLVCTDLVCYHSFEFFGNANGTFLSRWSYVFDGETKEPW